MRLLITTAVLEVDLRLAHRGSCGRSLLHLRADARVKPAPGRFDERRSRVPHTLVMLDVELVDRRWRKVGRPIELLASLHRWTATNRTYYAEGGDSCPDCGAARVAGKRPNHTVGCRLG